LSEIESEFDHHRVKISSLQQQLDSMNASIRRDTDRLMHTFSNFVLGPTHQRDEPILTELKNSPAQGSAAPPKLFEYSGARAIGKATDSIRSSPSPDSTNRSAGTTQAHLQIEANLANDTNARSENGFQKDLEHDDVFVERFKSILEEFPQRIQRAVVDDALRTPINDRDAEAVAGAKLAKSES